jgi:hypothetical protein
MKNEETKEKKEKKMKNEETKEKIEKKADLIQPLKVDITIKGISGLKMPIALDNEGHLTVVVQFHARIRPFEIFRLANLISQPNGGLSATFSSPQSAMDFQYDEKAGTVDVLKSVKELPVTTAKEKKPSEETKKESVKEAGKSITFHEVSFNHMEKEPNPFGVLITYVDTNGELKDALGRGKSAAEAVIAGIKQTEGFNLKSDHLFEILNAIKKTPETTAQIKIVRTLEMGEFFEDSEENENGGIPNVNT